MSTPRTPDSSSHCRAGYGAESTDPTQCSATELLALYRTKACSPVEATDTVLSRISTLNDRLNAFRLVGPDRAVAVAATRERGSPKNAGGAASHWGC